MSRSICSGSGKPPFSTMPDERREGPDALREQHAEQHLGAVGRHDDDRALDEPRQHVDHRHPGDDDAEHLAVEQVGVALDERRRRRPRMIARTDGATRNGSSGIAQTATDAAAPSGAGRGVDADRATRRPRRRSRRAARGRRGWRRRRAGSRARGASSASASSAICAHLVGGARLGVAELLGRPRPWPARPPSTSSTGAPRFAAMRAL